ncbi:MAG: GNAT family N-acetyltransferase [Actinomycetales bacterium]|nr:GNAT family N-acetyltransferase [Actinomycetales bacterium]
MSDQVAGASALTTRPIRYGADGVDREDLAVAVRLVTACDVAVLGGPDSGAGDVEALLTLPTTDRDAAFLAFDGDEPVGLCWVEADTTARDTFVDVFAPPGLRALEVRDLGLARGVEVAHRHRDAAPEPGPWTVRSGAWTADEDYAAVILAHGFTPVRRFYRMRIESASPLVPATAPPLPDGVALVVSDDEATRRRICAVDNEAFLDHWHFVPREYDEWWGHMSSGSTRDPDGWWLLTVDGTDAAICLLDESRADIGDGYVSILGVRKEFRGRGLARMLLQRAFVHYRDIGRAGTQLGVDAENTTGAVRLYESVGMTAVRAMQGYALTLD